MVGRGKGIEAACNADGHIGAVAATRLMESLLFQVGRLDPMVFGLVTATLGVAGFVACVVPARRATRVDPIVALRGE